MNARMNEIAGISEWIGVIWESMQWLTQTTVGFFQMIRWLFLLADI